jgi:hypothetical protein
LPNKAKVAAFGQLFAGQKPEKSALWQKTVQYEAWLFSCLIGLSFATSSLRSLNVLPRSQS